MLCCGIKVCVPVVDPVTPSVNAAPPLLILISNGWPAPARLLKIYVNPLYSVRSGLSTVPSIPGPANLYADDPLAVTSYSIVGPDDLIVILPSASLVVSIPVPPLN